MIYRRTEYVQIISVLYPQFDEDTLAFGGRVDAGRPHLYGAQANSIYAKVRGHPLSTLWDLVFSATTSRVSFMSCSPSASFCESSLPGSGTHGGQMYWPTDIWKTLVTTTER